VTAAACSRAPLGGLRNGQGLRGLGLQRIGLGQRDARPALRPDGLLLQHPDPVEDVGAVRAGRLEQRGPFDQLAGVGRGEQRVGTGPGAALHVATPGEGDDVVARDAQVGGRPVGGGRGGDRAAVRGLVPGRGGLVVVEGERRGDVRLVDRLLGGREPAVERRDAGDDGVLGRPGVGDLPVAGGRAGRAGGQPDGQQAGDRRPRDPRQDRARARTGVHVPGIDADGTRVECASPRGGRRPARVTAGGSPRERVSAPGAPTSTRRPHGA
jgi:hypothetical protein